MGFPRAAAGPVTPPARVAADKRRRHSRPLRVRKRQDVDKLYVRAAMSELGTLSAKGTVKRVKRYRFKKVSKRAVLGKLVKLRLKLSKKGLRAAKRALKRGKRVPDAKVTITARDAAGNPSAREADDQLKD